MNMCICITESLCCTPKINIVNQLFVNKFFLKIFIRLIGLCSFEVSEREWFYMSSKEIGEKGASVVAQW